MNQAVETILSRMESHPEEFQPDFSRGSGKWDWVLSQVCRRYDRDVDPDHTKVHPVGFPRELPFLSDEEITILYQKYQLMQESTFAHRVMATLLNEPEEDEVKADASYTRYAANVPKNDGMREALKAYKSARIAVTGVAAKTR